jgi:RNase P protein component
VILQTLEDYGFGEVFISMNISKTEYLAILRMIYDDIPVTMRNAFDRERVRRHIRNVFASNAGVSLYRLQCAYTLMLILMVPKDPYELAFTILSSLYRS